MYITIFVNMQAVDNCTFHSSWLLNVIFPIKGLWLIYAIVTNSRVKQPNWQYDRRVVASIEFCGGATRY